MNCKHGKWHSKQVMCKLCDLESVEQGKEMTATTETILASTAFMNQPATRAFRVELVEKQSVITSAQKHLKPLVQQEFIVWYRSPDGSRWEGSYEETLSKAWQEFVRRSGLALGQTQSCADRLEPEYQPFVASSKLGCSVTNDQFRW